MSNQIPQPSVGVRYLHEKLQEANHMVCLLLEQNEAQGKRIAELEKNQKRKRTE